MEEVSHPSPQSLSMPFDSFQLFKIVWKKLGTGRSYGMQDRIYFFVLWQQFRVKLQQILPSLDFSFRSLVFTEFLASKRAGRFILPVPSLMYPADIVSKLRNADQNVGKRGPAQQLHRKALRYQIFSFLLSLFVCLFHSVCSSSPCTPMPCTII